jgi:hypothetical protein
VKLFKCGNCNHILLFENTHCESCKHLCGFDPLSLNLLTLKAGDNYLTEICDVENTAWRYCKNHDEGVCHWLVRGDANSEFCLACELNRYIPNLKDIENLTEWRALEPISCSVW